MQAGEYKVVCVGDRWEVRPPSCREPVAVYRDPGDALGYALEAARQRAELDGTRPASAAVPPTLRPAARHRGRG
jgi:hypothetical protein